MQNRETLAEMQPVVSLYFYKKELERVLLSLLCKELADAKAGCGHFRRFVLTIHLPFV